MKKIVIFCHMISSGIVFSQVGVNTTSPQTTLDLRGKNHLGPVTPTDGLLVPRVNDLSVSGTVNGQLVYLIQNSGSFAKGFHYWNGTAWIPFIASGSYDSSVDAWVDNPAYSRIELGTKSDGSPRATGTEFVAEDNGNIGIGTATPHPAAAVDITSNTKGLKLPYVSLQSRTDLTTVLNPADGLMVYNPGTGTTLASGIYIFDWPSQTWGQLQKFSATSGSNINKIIYYANAGVESKTVTIGNYQFRINSSNIIQMAHSKSTAAAEVLSIIDNVFTSPDTFWYSAPKNLSLAEGNTTWSANTTASISAALDAGRVITIYFTDSSENRFYRVVFFRGTNVNGLSPFTILAEQF